MIDFNITLKKYKNIKKIINAFLMEIFTYFIVEGVKDESSKNSSTTSND